MANSPIDTSDIKDAIVKFEKLPGMFRRSTVLGMTRAVETIRDYAATHHNFKSRTGKLESAIKSKVVLDPLRGYVYIDETIAPYGKYVHEGTKPHTITPKNGKMLRFPISDGSFVFAREVHHPGTKPDPFLQTAFMRSESGVITSFFRAIKNAFKEVF